MTTWSLCESIAVRYADLVINELVAVFPGLPATLHFGQIRVGIIHHAMYPDEPFEMSLDMTRHWRLHSESGFNERWRVLLNVHKDDWTSDDVQFVDNVNAKFRAVTLEEI